MIRVLINNKKQPPKHELYCHFNCSLYLQCLAVFWGDIRNYALLCQPTFAIPRTVGEGGGYICNSCRPLAPASQTLRH